MWRKNLKDLSPSIELFDPASLDAIARAELALGAQLPSELRELLRETDGVRGKYSLRLVWSADEIAAENVAFRTNESFRELYMSFDDLMFFADAGNGDQFAFRVLADEVRYDDIYVWNHENDSRTWIAPSLREFLAGWIRGTLKV